jgi:hypothetical protein
MQELAEPGCFFGQVNLSCLKANALRFHADKLVPFWGDSDWQRHAWLWIGPELLNQMQPGAGPGVESGDFST